MPSFIMVLNDGETFTNLEGCAIVRVPDSITDTEGVEEFLDADDGTSTVAYFDVVGGRTQADDAMPSMVMVKGKEAG